MAGKKSILGNIGMKALEREMPSGLDGLFGPLPTDETGSIAKVGLGSAVGYYLVPVDLIFVTDGFNPRTVFEEKELERLAGQIERHGILSPLLVRASEEGRFALIDGERRFRACQLINERMQEEGGKRIGEVPCRVMGEDISDDEALLMAVATDANVNLSPMEEASLFARMRDNEYTPEKIADLTGRTVQHVYDRLRMHTNLTEKVKGAVVSGEISLTQARWIEQTYRKDPEAQDKALDEAKRSKPIRGRKKGQKDKKTVKEEASQAEAGTGEAAEETMPAVPATTPQEECSSCEFHRSRGNKQSGQLIPDGQGGHHPGKCIRPEGICGSPVYRLQGFEPATPAAAGENLPPSATVQVEESIVDTLLRDMVLQCRRYLLDGGTGDPREKFKEFAKGVCDQLANFEDTLKIRGKDLDVSASIEKPAQVKAVLKNLRLLITGEDN